MCDYSPSVRAPQDNFPGSRNQQRRLRAFRQRHLRQQLGRTPKCRHRKKNAYVLLCRKTLLSPDVRRTEHRSPYSDHAAAAARGVTRSLRPVRVSLCSVVRRRRKANRQMRSSPSRWLVGLQAGEVLDERHPPNNRFATSRYAMKNRIKRTDGNTSLVCPEPTVQVKGNVSVKRGETMVKPYMYCSPCCNTDAGYET